MKITEEITGTIHATLLVSALCMGLLLPSCGGRDIDDPGTGGKSAAVSGSVYQGEQDHKLQGALVSQLGAVPSNSTTSDAAGAYSLTVPMGQQLTLRADKTGLLPALNSVLVSGTGQSKVDLPMVTKAYMDAKLAEAKMPACHTTKGLVAVVFDRTSGGEVAGLDAASDGSMTVLKGTDKGVKSKAIMPGGSRALIFSNVATGSTSVTLTATGCQLRQAGITSYPVVAGALSIIEVVCP